MKFKLSYQWRSGLRRFDQLDFLQVDSATFNFSPSIGLTT